jgi:hypothetical protein
MNVNAMGHSNKLAGSIGILRMTMVKRMRLTAWASGIRPQDLSGT